MGTKRRMKRDDKVEHIYIPPPVPIGCGMDPYAMERLLKIIIIIIKMTLAMCSCCQMKKNFDFIPVALGPIQPWILCNGNMVNDDSMH
jgi:hypothetical protein